MKKLIAIFSLAILPALGFASGGAGPHLEKANIDLTDQASLQRGAKYFVNYCFGCHSLKYFRYEGLKGIGLTEDEIKGNLMFGNNKIGDLMTISMPTGDAAAWFGAAAPDLTLETRLRPGPDWVYSYLKGFYADPSRPMGVNNTIFPNVGMPHVLAELQGIQTAEIKTDEHGQKVVEALKPGTGKLSAEEYDGVARDLSAFLAYVAEPMKLERQRIGVYVMLFLVVLFVFAYLLKKEYWKDVH